MLDFARSNTISTQTSNIYLYQLPWYGQFAEVYMLLEVLSLEIYPSVSVTNSFPIFFFNFIWTANIAK